MRKLFLSFAIASLSVFMVSCGGGEGEKTSDLTGDKTEEKSEDATDADAAEATEETPKADLAGKKAIALFNSSYYSKPGNEGWLGRFNFGNSLTLQGDTASVTTTNRTRIYYKVTAPDGKEGWVYGYYLAIDAELKVVTSDQIIYKNPDVTSLTTDKFKKGEMIAVINSGEESNGFAQAQNASRKINGGSTRFVWIKKGKGLSSDETDIMIATQLKMVADEKDEKKKLAILDAILDEENNATSKLYELAMEQKKEMTSSEEEAVEEVSEEVMEEAAEAVEE